MAFLNREIVIIPVVLIVVLVYIVYRTSLSTPTTSLVTESSSASQQTESDVFPQCKDVTLPSCRIYKTYDCTLRDAWMNKLYQVLSHTENNQNPQVNLVIADKSNIELLLNWLITALVRLKEPLQNIVVLGLDTDICEQLPHSINCVHIDPNISFQPGDDKYFSHKYLAPQIRLLVERLINCWGYSFASYDTDAVILKNPQPLYDAHREVNMIAGAAGVWPTWAIEQWGFSLCPGTILVRSGPSTESLWLAINNSWGEMGSEQDQFNQALRDMGIKWNKRLLTKSKSDALCKEEYGWRGVATSNLSVLLLPQSQFCRKTCCNGTKYYMSDMYVAHGSGGNIGNVSGKIDYLKRTGMWFLKTEWSSLPDTGATTAFDWLKQRSTLP